MAGRKNQDQAMIRYSSLINAFQGIEGGDEAARLWAAIQTDRFCAVLVDDASAAKAISSHFQHMKAMAALWKHLPQQQQTQAVEVEGGADPTPRYHGYLSSHDNGIEVVDLRMQSKVDEQLRAMLPEAGGAFSALDRIARMVLQAIGKGLGLVRSHHLQDELLDADPLPADQWSSSILSSIHYHHKPHTRNRQQAGSAPVQLDCGLLTVGYSDSPGLQVLKPGEDWVDLPYGPRGEHVVVWVLAGDTLRRATGGIVRPAIHRVVSANGGSSAGRHSLVFKQRGRPSAMLQPAQLAPLIRLKMPELARCRQTMTVRDFEADFEDQHPSTTYPDNTRQKGQQQQPQQKEKGVAAAASFSTGSQPGDEASGGGGGGRAGGEKRAAASTADGHEQKKRQQTASEGATHGSSVSQGVEAESSIQAPSPSFTVLVKDYVSHRRGEVTPFRVRNDTRPWGFLPALAENLGCQPMALRLFCDGIRVLPGDTVGSLRMKDGDELLVVGEQLG